MNDRYWVVVKDFLGRWMRSGDKVCGPIEFAEVLGEVIPGYLLKWGGNSILLGEKRFEPDFFILHKGLTANFDEGVIEWVTDNLAPVFANEVFVVYAGKGRVNGTHDCGREHLGFQIERPKSSFGRMAQHVKAEDDVRHVVLISVDTLRYDCPGYQEDKSFFKMHGVSNSLRTPILDGIAEDGVCFTHAHSSTTYTTSAHASMITGLYPPGHGVRAFYDTRLADEVGTLAEAFAENGFVTVLATDNPDLWLPLGLDRGFSRVFIRDDRALFDFIRKHREQKIFLLIHLFDIHGPFLYSECPSAPGVNEDYFAALRELYTKNGISFDEAQRRNKPHEAWREILQALNHDIDQFLPLYIRGVNKFDEGRFRELIEELDELLGEDRILVVTADHGEGQCFEGNDTFFGHGGGLFGDVMRIPLIIHQRGLTPGMVKEPVSIVDLFPTLLEMACGYRTIWGNMELDGMSLLPLIHGENSGSDISTFNMGHRVLYGEVWITKQGIYLKDVDQVGPKLDIDREEELEWLLFQRAIICGNLLKYIIYGRPESIGPHASSPSRDLVDAYRKIRARFEAEEEMNILRNVISRYDIPIEDVIHSFIKLEGSCRAIKYDLLADPHEDHPVPIEGMRVMNEVLRVLKGFERNSVVSEKIFNEVAGKEEEEIKDRLRALGYIG